MPAAMLLLTGSKLVEACKDSSLMNVAFVHLVHHWIRQALHEVEKLFKTAAAFLSIHT